MSDKKMSPVLKGVIWVGVLGITGVALWAGHKYIYKPWKAKKDLANGVGQQDDKDSISSGTTTTVSDPVTTKTSFEKLKDSIKSMSGYKNFVTHVVLTSTPTKLGINTTKLGINPNTTVKIKFTGGGWGMWVGEIDPDNRISVGDYTNGGEVIKVTTGRNAGIQTEGKNVIQNIGKAIS